MKEIYKLYDYLYIDVGNIRYKVLQDTDLNYNNLDFPNIIIENNFETEELALKTLNKVAIKGLNYIIQKEYRL